MKYISAIALMLTTATAVQANYELCRNDEVTVLLAAGTSSLVFQEQLNELPGLADYVETPAEGSLLPGHYCIAKSMPRNAALKQMQDAMAKTVAELWPIRSATTQVNTPEEAVILASIVEKATSQKQEFSMVAAVYSNRLRNNMMLQADPTIIYPITKGKPLGRRIRMSEIQVVNGYNTYSMVGLPKGPITNPSREAIDAVLNPAKTNALFFVEDGTGGLLFADTLEEQSDNVEKWYAIRRERGEM